MAEALGVQAGRLVDGGVPGEEERVLLSREAMERICRAVFSGRLPADPFEAKIARLLSVQLAHRLSVAPGRARVCRSRQGWLWLKGLLPSGELRGLLSRLEKEEQLAR